MTPRLGREAPKTTASEISEQARSADSMGLAEAFLPFVWVAYEHVGEADGERITRTIMSSTRPAYRQALQIVVCFS